MRYFLTLIRVNCNKKMKVIIIHIYIYLQCFPSLIRVNKHFMIVMIDKSDIDMYVVFSILDQSLVSTATIVPRREGEQNVARVKTWPSTAPSVTLVLKVLLRLLVMYQWNCEFEFFMWSPIGNVTWIYDFKIQVTGSTAWTIT